MKKYFVIVLFLLTLQVNRPLWAQVFTEKGKITQTIKAGETVADSLFLHNTSQGPVTVKVYWEDFQYQPPFDGSKKFSPPGTTSNSCSRWVRFSPSDFTILPFGKQKISYTINAPADARGGYYGVLFFEPQAQDAKTSTGVRIVTRVGSLFFLETDDKIKKASIDGVKMEAGTLFAKLSNNGNVILLPQGTFYILNSENVVADRGEIKNLYLPPSQKGDFQFDIKKDLSRGFYTIVMTFDLQDGDVSVKEIEFEKIHPAGYKITKIHD